MPNILIVEDDKTIAEAMIFRLKNSGFSCQWFATGGEALNHLKNFEVDLILLDIGLPDIDGFDVLRIIRRESNIPVIILTARNESEDQVLALEGLEADAYIIKKGGSDDPRVMIAQIKAVLKRSKSVPVAKKNNAIFELDEALQQVLFKGQALNLTPAERKILTHLIKDPNRAISRKTLLSIIYDGPVGSDESVITTHVKSIRRTLKKIDPDNQYIHTHRGTGYSLIL